jgi:hypothetical protein
MQIALVLAWKHVSTLSKFSIFFIVVCMRVKECVDEMSKRDDEDDYDEILSFFLCIYFQGIEF